MIDKIKYLQGYVRVRLSGYAPERFLNLCSNHNILIWNLEYREEQYEFCISLRGFRQLKPMLRKTRTKLVIVERTGLPFAMRRYRKRKLFFAGIMLCCALLYVMSLFVWKIEVNGNLHETDHGIIKFLEEKQVYHGLLKSKIDCEKIEEELRAGYEDIIWASAKLKGTMLIIDIQENLATNQQAQEKQSESDEPSDLIADKEAEIYSILTRAGTPQVEKGMQVKPGDLLVEGKNSVLNDAGEIASYQYCVSDADILGITSYTYHDSFPMKYEDKVFTDRKSSAYGLQMYQIETKQYTKQEAENLANKNLKEFCKELSEKGVQIIENNVMIVTDGKNCTASGDIKVIEPIGIRKATSITDLTQEGQMEDESDGDGN